MLVIFDISFINSVQIVTGSLRENKEDNEKLQALVSSMRNQATNVEQELDKIQRKFEVRVYLGLLKALRGLPGSTRGFLGLSWVKVGDFLVE